MATTLQRQTTKRSDTPKFFCSHILILVLSFQPFTKILQKAKSISNCCAFPKNEAVQVNYRTWQYKGRRGLRDPRRPIEPSNLLSSEKAARHRQQT